MTDFMINLCTSSELPSDNPPSEGNTSEIISEIPSEEESENISEVPSEDASEETSEDLSEVPSEDISSGSEQLETISLQLDNIQTRLDHSLACALVLICLLSSVLIYRIFAWFWKDL